MTRGPLQDRLVFFPRWAGGSRQKFLVFPLWQVRLLLRNFRYSLSSYPLLLQLGFLSRELVRISVSSPFSMHTVLIPQKNLSRPLPSESRYSVFQDFDLYYLTQCFLNFNVTQITQGFFFNVDSNSVCLGCGQDSAFLSWYLIYKVCIMIK